MSFFGRIECLHRSEAEQHIHIRIRNLVETCSVNVLAVDVGGDFYIRDRHAICIGIQCQHGATDGDIVGDLVRIVLVEHGKVKLGLSRHFCFFNLLFLAYNTSIGKYF